MTWITDFLRSFAFHTSYLIFFHAGLYWIVVGLVNGILRALPSDFVRRHQIGERKIRPGQVRREILTSMRSVVVITIISAIIFALSDMGILQVYYRRSEHSDLWFVASTLILIVLQDTWIYWTHRAQHHPRLYKTFHATHHKSKYSTPYAAYAFDVGEAAVHTIYIGVMAAIMPLSLLSLGLFMLHMIAKNAWGHSGHEFRPARRNGKPWVDIVTVNTHHELHHTHVRGNYGVYFTFWDRLMGTEVPVYHETYRKAIGFQWPDERDDDGADSSQTGGDRRSGPALATP